MTTATRGLVRYDNEVGSHRSTPGHSGWQDQVNTAASYLAAAALGGSMPNGGAAMSERQLARYLATQAVRRRRTSTTKLAVIMLGEAIALAAGCYIGRLG